MELLGYRLSRAFSTAVLTMFFTLIISKHLLDCGLHSRACFVYWGAYHLAKKSGNLGLKSNGKVIFRKFRSEIVEYLQRYSSFFIRNGTAENSLPFK